MNKEEIDNILENLYDAYGSGTGVLFGIPLELKYSVRAIIKAVSDNQIDKQKVKTVIEYARNHCRGEPDKMEEIFKKEFGLE